jgi:hypothetical protein
MNLRLSFACGIFGGILAGTFSPALSQEEPPEKDDDEGGEQETEASEPSEREKKVLALFNASEARFEKGVLILTYDFETKNYDLVQDWLPLMEETKKRIRWSGKEGPTRDGTDKDGYKIRVYVPGVIIADYGQWTHRGVFLPDVEVEVTLYSMAQPRAGTIVAATFGSEKKRAVGVSNGYQAVCLTGARPAHQKPPVPTKDRPLARDLRQTIGFRYNGKMLETYKDGKKTGDSSTAPKFTEGIGSGRVGLAWNGQVQCFVHIITIKGKLDPDWVAAALGEKPDKAGREADRKRKDGVLGGKS